MAIPQVCKKRRTRGTERYTDEMKNRLLDLQQSREKKRLMHSNLQSTVVSKPWGAGVLASSSRDVQLLFRLAELVRRLCLRFPKGQYGLDDSNMSGRQSH